MNQQNEQLNYTTRLACIKLAFYYHRKKYQKEIVTTYLNAAKGETHEFR